LFLIVLALTSRRWLGTVAYWLQNTLFFMTAPLSFAFGMEVAKRSRSVLSAWLNVAFWIGQAVAAPVTGALFADTRYTVPVLMAAFAVGLAAALNRLLFLPVERQLKQGAFEHG
jgi:predicted MFS family arabinose efflux permease